MLHDVKLRKELIAKINSTEDAELLSQISRLIGLELQTEDVYSLSPAEVEAVNEGINQLDKGLFLSNNESNKLVDQWLKR